MKKTNLFLMIMLIFLSCSKSKTENKIQNNSIKSPETTKNREYTIPVNKPQEIAKVKDTIDFTLDSFIVIPKEIDGCGCYFYSSIKDKKNEKYIFINDFAKFAFISINNEIEKFNLVKHDEIRDTYLYTNKHYNLKIEIHKKEDGGEEESILKGMIILSKGDAIIKKEFVGTCGC